MLKEGIEETREEKMGDRIRKKNIMRERNSRKKREKFKE